jgi:glycosyltransferase involved in cell wall biosynthesis
MSDGIRASVIIPSFQSARTIDACLGGIFRQVSAGPFEVIVADSGTDQTAELIAQRYPAARVLKSEKRLDPALARNWGAHEARGPVLAFIDSDCAPGPDWLARLCSALENGSYDAVGGAIRNVEGANSASWAGYFCEFREFLPLGAPADATNLTLGNAAYRRAIFQQAGGFPGGYFPQEDQVFHNRLLAAGARILFDPSIVVRHVHRSTVSSFLAHQRRIGAANARVVRTLGLKGAGIASRRWLATALLPGLATYRFGRTIAACWRQEHCLVLRRPSIAGLCWLGMVAWGVGFARPRAGCRPERAG